MSECSVGSQPDPLVRDPVLGGNLPLGEPFEWALAEPAPGFIALDHRLCRGKRRPLASVHLALHTPLILCDGIIHVLTLSELIALCKWVAVLEGLTDQGVGSRLVDTTLKGVENYQRLKPKYC